MKILALMPDAYGGFGGIAQYNRDLIDALSESAGVEAIVSLTRNAPDSRRSLPAKVSQEILPGDARLYALRAATRCLNFKPDIIICGHVNLLPVAIVLKKLTRRPVVLEAYGIDIWQRGGRLRVWGIKHVDLVIAISRFTREKVLAWSGIEPHRVRVVPNAVHLEHYSQSAKPAYLVERYGLTGKGVLLTVGRLPGNERYKGLDRIIKLLPRLIAEFPNLVYVIVGDGSDRARLESLVETMGLASHVLFTGKISEREKTDHYNLADAFAMPSLSEGFGFVFLEAAACGVPVLGGSRDGSRDALVDGKLGVMVDPENPEELLNGLVEILNREKRIPEALAQFAFPRFKRQIEQMLIGGPLTSDL
jgi:phosphatidylinositol alpha-1,6-mannosyltransferase